MQRNKIVEGDIIEFMVPNGKDFKQEVKDMVDINNNEISSTPHAQMIYYMKVDSMVVEDTLVRKDKEN